MNSSWGRAWALGATALLTVLIGMTGCEAPTDEDENTPPEIVRITTTADSVLPGETVTLTAITQDPDVDTLGSPQDISYQWIAEGGEFSTDPFAHTVEWNAPQDTGRYWVWLYINDTIASDTDSVAIRVVNLLASSDLAVRILSPDDSSHYTTSDEIEFRGRVVDFEDWASLEIEAEWSSSVDGLLHTAEPDSEGIVAFTTTLSDTIHDVSFRVTADNTFTASKTINLSIFDVNPVTLYPVERNYESNRITWDHDADELHFLAYSVRRTGGPEVGEEIARIEDPAATQYVDTSLVLGRVYNYELAAEYDFDLATTAGPATIRAGVYNDFNGEVTDLWFDEQEQYLYLATPTLEAAWAIDVTANNVDRHYWFRDELPDEDYEIVFAAHGFAYSANERILYTASPGDSAIWRIHLDQYYMDRWVDRRGAGTEPLYMDFDDQRRTLYVSANNRFPFTVRQTGSTVTVTPFYSSEQIASNSTLIVDDANDRLYLSELGSFPASLWSYDITTTPPTLLAEDEHNTLGYGTWDFAMHPAGGTLYMAGASPHFVQVISSSTLARTGSIPTGSDPRALHLAPDGQTLYAGQENTVQVWDLQAEEMTGQLEFEDTIAPGGVLVSEDGSIWMVVTESGGNARVFIVYR